jgi:hypothetical protein
VADEFVNARVDVLCAFGDAMLAAQTLEEAMAGLLGARREILLVDTKLMSADFGPEREEIWGEIFSATAGSLRSQLGLTGELGEELKRAVAARNLLAHHYLRDRFFAGGPGTGDVSKLKDAADRFLALARAVVQERDALLRAKGLSEDEISTVVDVRRWERNYDPRVDWDVPPEPFEPWEPPRTAYK